MMMWIVIALLLSMEALKRFGGRFKALDTVLLTTGILGINVVVFWRSNTAEIDGIPFTLAITLFNVSLAVKLFLGEVLKFLKEARTEKDARIRELKDHEVLNELLTSGEAVLIEYTTEMTARVDDVTQFSVVFTDLSTGATHAVSKRQFLTTFRRRFK